MKDYDIDLITKVCNLRYREEKSQKEISEPSQHLHSSPVQDTEYTDRNHRGQEQPGPLQASHVTVESEHLDQRHQQRPLHKHIGRPP